MCVGSDDTYNCIYKLKIKIQKHNLMSKYTRFYLHIPPATPDGRVLVYFFPGRMPKPGVGCLIYIVLQHPLKRTIVIISCISEYYHKSMYLFLEYNKNENTKANHVCTFISTK